MFPVLIAIAKYLNGDTRTGKMGYRYINIQTEEILDIPESIETQGVGRALKITFNGFTENIAPWFEMYMNRNKNILSPSSYRPWFRYEQCREIHPSDDKVILVCTKGQDVLAVDLFGKVVHGSFDYARKMYQLGKAIVFNPQIFKRGMNGGLPITDLGDFCLLQYREVPADLVNDTIQALYLTIHRSMTLNTRLSPSVMTKIVQEKVEGYDVEQYNMLPLFKQVFKLLYTHCPYMCFTDKYIFAENDKLLFIEDITAKYEQYGHVVVSSFVRDNQIFAEAKGQGDVGKVVTSALRRIMSNSGKARDKGYFHITTFSDYYGKFSVDEYMTLHTHVLYDPQTDGFGSGQSKAWSMPDLEVSFGECPTGIKTRYLEVFWENSLVQRLDLTNFPITEDISQRKLCIKSCANLRELRLPDNQLNALQLEYTPFSNAVLPNRIKVNEINLSNVKYDTCDLSKITVQNPAYPITLKLNNISAHKMIAPNSKTKVVFLSTTSVQIHEILGDILGDTDD